jgi:Fe-S cluster assembly protein SufD
MPPATAELDARQLADAVAAAAPGMPWLDAARARALQAFAARGVPTTADEDWRYTDLGPAARRLTAPAAQAEPTAGQTGPLLRELLETLAPAPTLVFVQGRYRPELSTARSVPGLELVPFSAAAPRDLEGLAGRLVAATAEGGLAALNTALLRDGLWLRIAPRARHANPIHVVLAGAGDTVSHCRLLIDLGPASQATVVEHHLSAGPRLSNTVTDVSCAPDVRLTYVKIQAESDDATHLARQAFVLGDASHLEVLHLDLGARLARNDLTVRLAGCGASIDSNGLFFADGSRHLDNHTRIDHETEQTRSRELFRGIADDKGRGVFNGKVIVHPGAVRTDARLGSQNLLLSPAAEIDTKPQLEINADDVKCSHGATTGQLDANAIFYLRSRGVAIDTARRMLIAAFACEIVRHLPAPSLKTHVMRLLAPRLPELQEVC